MDVGTRTATEKPWWTLPENFDAPMVFHMEADQEELIFGEWPSLMSLSSASSSQVSIFPYSATFIDLGSLPPRPPPHSPRAAG